LTEIRPSPPKSQTDLALEWDQLAEERHRQISSGEDISFEHVVVPTIWQLLEGADPAVILDVGSGTGDFTSRLARIAGDVIAIEPSRASTALARAVCQDAQNVRFVESSLEEAVNAIEGRQVTAAVAMMTLMTVPDLRGVAKALAATLDAGAHFVATVTHPWFWPRYWGYEKEPWFHYETETFIEAPFVITKRRSNVRTTHIHRPLQQYVNVFANEGFRLDILVEPMPGPEVQALYAVPWEYPRFLGLGWKKVI
jgi:SAM-dependent methyltransferase